MVKKKKQSDFPLPNKAFPSRKEKILQASLEVFAQKGKAGARVYEIAQRAEVNKALVHYYFSSKDQLYAQVFEHYFGQILGEVKQVMLKEKEMELSKRLENIIELYFDFIVKNPQFARLISWELLDGAPIARKVFQKLFQKEKFSLPENFQNLIQQGIKEKKIYPVDSSQVVLSVMGMILFYFFARPLFLPVWGIKPGKEEEFLKARKRHIKNLLRRGLFLEEAQKKERKK